MARNATKKRQGPEEEPTGAVPVDIASSSETWSTYELADGTKLRVRPVVVEVQRMEGQYNPEGDPVYAMKTSLIVDVRVPQGLKKK